MATSSRGVSYYSEGNFGCPATLLNVTIPRGHCTEGTSQAFMRFCGECSLLGSHCWQGTSVLAKFRVVAYSSCSCTEPRVCWKHLAVPGCLMAPCCEYSCNVIAMCCILCR